MAKRNTQKKQWSVEQKARIVGEAAELSEHELGAYLRREGVHPSELEAWRTALDYVYEHGLENAGGGIKEMQFSLDHADAQWMYPETNRSGIYIAKFGKPLDRQKIFAVNVDTVESDLSKINDLPKGFTTRIDRENLDDPVLKEMDQLKLQQKRPRQL